jgi:transposase-like protein
MSQNNGALPATVNSNTEVVARSKRRTFTAEYKRQIVTMADQMSESERGALLRREGLFSSHLSEWRRALRGGQIQTDKRRGPKPNPEREQIRTLERQNARLEAKLKQAELIIEAQKKLAELLGTTLPTEEEILGRRRDR